MSLTLAILWGSSLSATCQNYPAVSYGTESFLVVWQGDHVGGKGVYGMRVAEDGKLLDSVAFPIHPDGSYAYPDVAFGGGNWGVIAWTEVGDGTYRLDFVRVSPEGDVLDPSPTQVCSGDVYRGALAFDGLFTYLAVWYDNSAEEIRGARISVTGTVLDPWGFTVASARRGAEPEICYDGNAWLVVWNDWIGAKLGTFGARVSSDGTVLDPAGFVVRDPDESNYQPSVSAGGGKSLVVWEESEDTYGAFVDPGGSVLAPGTFNISLFHSPGVAYGAEKWLVVMERPHQDFFTPKMDASFVDCTGGVTLLDAGNDGIGSGWGPASVAFGTSSWLAVWWTGTDWGTYEPNIAGRLVDASGTLQAQVLASQFVNCRLDLYAQGTTNAISTVAVDQAFDICVEPIQATPDDPIRVRFSSDELQDGDATGSWTAGMSGQKRVAARGSHGASLLVAKRRFGLN